MKGYRLITLNGRLNFSGFASCWFKRFGNTPVLSVLLVFVLQQAFAEDVYELTDRTGRKLEAIIHEYNSGEVAVERVGDGRRFNLSLDTLSGGDLRYLETHFKESDSFDEAQILVPGEKVLLDFPELGSMASGQPAQCELSVPKTYDPLRPVPLLVWFSGGKGSYKTNGAKGLVDFDEFLVLALPYPNGRLPRLAVDAGNDEINTFWEFQMPMLRRVIKMVPNISEDVRIAGGSSSGAHLVGSALDQKWRGFCDYFTGYVLHEGGYSPEMSYKGTRSSHRILVIYGENSTSRECQEFLMERFEQARGRIDYIEVLDAGHGLNGDGKKLIRGWIGETFRKDLL